MFEKKLKINGNLTKLHSFLLSYLYFHLIHYDLLNIRFIFESSINIRLYRLFTINKLLSCFDSEML